MAAFGNNGPDLLLGTADLGMPVAGNQSGQISDYNWLTGAIVP